MRNLKHTAALSSTVKECVSLLVNSAGRFADVYGPKLVAAIGVMLTGGGYVLVWLALRRTVRLCVVVNPPCIFQMFCLRFVLYVILYVE